jgi:hypothetical protein
MLKLTFLGIGYAVVLVGSWELQKTDLLLGYTLGVIGVLSLTVGTIDYLSRKMN